jgi:transketolase
MDLSYKTNEIRRMVLQTVSRARGGHVGSSLSELEILATLYFHIMRISPAEPLDPARDRFVLSKGHASEGLYCTLAAAGFFSGEWLGRYLGEDCPLTIHPTTQVPGVEVNTGALGHGLSIACGMALGSQRSGLFYRVFTLTGDGELQEGSNWEALMAASHFKLGNLTLIVDNNGLQLSAPVGATMNIEPLGDKLAAFGFEVYRADGHSTAALSRVLENLDYRGDRPHAVIADTVKGRGVSFMENLPEWHHRIPTEAECTLALEELVP